MAAKKVSPLAPKDGFPRLSPVAGVRFASVAAGVHYRGRDDVMLAELAPGSVVAGVFTKSTTRSAAVLDCQAKIDGEHPRGAAILVNSGNANAFTGSYGMASVDAFSREVARSLKIARSSVFTASTGVIGEPLAHDRIIQKLNQLRAGLSPGAIKSAANAITTTDTFAKGSGTTLRTGDQTIRIAAIAKGSGMIAPDMATMLAYVFTDASVARPVLQAMLAQTANLTFNCITVDSDTSTSDTLMIAATGRACAAEITSIQSDAGQAFLGALHDVMLDLAQQVVRDGEGASKFVEVRVNGAVSDADAHKAAMSVANSPLVKTAIAGEDANWGRVVMAIGKSGAQADRDRLSIWFGDILVAENGWVSPDYDEAAATVYMKRDSLVIGIDLGLGAGRAVVWTCDLTHGYIQINADYRS
ncbi:MAG: bifunctional glutamate N-acetyltransferase/amino-acid acetyltransferase ArgJ [Paracoccaceae bacterium]